MKQRLLSLLFILLGAVTLHAQEGAGRSWILAFPDTTTTILDPRFPNDRFADRALIHIYSAADNRLRISGVGFERVEQVTGGSFTIIDLMDPVRPAPDPIVKLSNTVARNTFRVEADEPVIIYCYLQTRFGSEAWTPLPVESWGREYFVAARPGEIVHDISVDDPVSYNRRRKMAPAVITIIAAYDDTRIGIASTADLLDASRDIEITLDAGEVYQVQSHVDTSETASLQPQISGSRVTASRPIGLLSGNTRAQAIRFVEGLAQNIYRNMLIEWLSPVEMHGTEFVYLPTNDYHVPTGAPGEDLTEKRKGEHVRIYATAAGITSGRSSGNTAGQSGFTIPAAGRFHEEFIAKPEARYYTLDRPAQVMMNSTAVVRYRDINYWNVIGASYGGPPPYMAELIPRHRWSSFAPYYTPADNLAMTHFVNVVTDSIHRNDVYMENGSRFDFNRGTIEGSGLIWGTMMVKAGRTYSLEGRNGARFSGHVYGNASAVEEFRYGDTLTGSPAEYEEYMTTAYGYPLSSRHTVVPSSVEREQMPGGSGAVIRPNPANSATTISFRMQSPGSATIVITDATGNEVATRTTDHLPAGVHSIEWEASALPAGVYLYRLRAASLEASGSIVVVR